jgi:RimJ/RimL family protein N-acetyltransferase
MNISGERLTLRILTSDDITGELGNHYVAWMNDPDTMQFLESRWRAHTLESIRAFVTAMNESPRDFQFGMFLKDSNIHIGNIKIGGIDQMHRRGDVGLLIGDKNAWGKGYATEAIELATRFAFEELNVNKLTAGMYAPNVGSYKAFIKAGWREVGILKAHCFYKGGYVDEFLVEKCRA